jgi:phage tail-like protein
VSLARERLAWRLDRRAGWRRGPRDDRVAAGKALRLRTLPGSGHALVDAGGTFGGLADATGMAVGADGSVYVLDGRTPALYRFDPCEAWERVPCVAREGSEIGEVRDPNGIALAPWGDLYVADTGNARVQVFTARGWRVREVYGPLRLDAAGAIPWEPFDVAVTPAGRTLVSDRAGGVIASFDRLGRLVATYDGAGDGFAPFARPTHVAVDAAGRVYVVQEGVEAVTVLAPDGRPLERIERHDEASGRFCPGPVAVDGEGNVFVADTASGRLVVFGPPEDRARWRPEVSCQPCGVDALVIGPGGRPVVARATLPRIEELDVTAKLEPFGTFTSGALDSTIYRCRWHRVVVRADVPAGTFLAVRTFTSEAPKSDEEIAALPADRWSEAVVHDGAGHDDWDCLVRSPEGRFLWLRLELEGTGALTPGVEAVTITYPRQTSTDYLPGIYRRQPGGDDFVERFLAIFDRTFADLAAEVDDLARYADPLATPAGEDGGKDFLTWLASWIGLSLERHWPVDRRRRLVAEASWLFAHRGTVAGLRRHLEIYLGYAPRILEHYRLRHWLYTGDARLGDSSTLWGSAIVNRLQLDVHSRLGGVQLVDTHDPLRDPFWVYAHAFTVFVPGPEDDDGRRHALERIIELAKPAHTKAVLRVVEPRLRVGQAMVGLDTVIGSYPRRTVEGSSRLGYDSVLGTEPDPPQPPSLQIGARRIGADTLID